MAQCTISELRTWNTIAVWPRTSSLHQRAPPARAAGGLAFSPDGQNLASVHQGGVVGVYDPISQNLKSLFRSNVTGCNGCVWAHDDSTLLYAGVAPAAGADSPPTGDPAVVMHCLAENKMVRLFQPNKAVVHGQPGSLSSVRLSPASDMLLAADSRGNVHMWDLRSPKQIGMISTVQHVAMEAKAPETELEKLLKPAGTAAPCIAFDPQGMLFTVASPLHQLAAYDARKDLSSAAAVADIAEGPFANEVLLSAHAKSALPYRLADPKRAPHGLPLVYSGMDFSPDGDLLAIGTQFGLLVLDAMSFAEIGVGVAHPTMVFEPRDASGGAPDQAPSHAPAPVLHAPTDTRYRVKLPSRQCAPVWSPDSSTVMVGGTDGRVYLYDVQNARDTDTPQQLACSALGDAALPAELHVRAKAFENCTEAWPPAVNKFGTGLGLVGHREQHSDSSFAAPASARTYAATSAQWKTSSSETQRANRHLLPVSALAVHHTHAIIASADFNVALWGHCTA